jgi:hypothetical protein
MMVCNFNRLVHGCTKIAILVEEKAVGVAIENADKLYNNYRSNRVYVW